MKPPHAAPLLDLSAFLAASAPRTAPVTAAALPRDRPVTVEDLQARLDAFLVARGCGPSDSHGVCAEVVDGLEDGMTAEADGMRVSAHAWGAVRMGRELVEQLDVDGVDFVLGHEAAHIFLNHGRARMPHELKELAIGITEIFDGSMALAGRFLYDGYRVFQQASGHPDSDALIVKRQELEADAEAVRLTGKLAPAIATLTHLVGGDLSKPSHLWEVFFAQMPIMSMEERLAALRARFPDLV